MRTVKSNELDIENVVLLTAEQAKARYNLGLNNLRILAEQIGQRFAWEHPAVRFCIIERN